MNISLPIYEYADIIVSAVKENAVTIISAETGSGKSTQVCQMLYEQGYDVIVTEPRRLAARTLAERVAEELNVELGCEVGYRTAFEREDSEDTRILFCTDGLQLVRSLTEKRERANRVLIIDEVHEWNLNIETLIAWAKSRVEDGWSTKVVVMSATMETEKLKNYFCKASVITVPGRVFPVTRKTRYEFELVPTVEALVNEGKNVLVFVPGKKEIDEVINKLSEHQVKAEIFPLHGELSSKEQNLCFGKYPLPKVVVATNIAQTSVTVPDIDAVVDTGCEKRIETDKYGVEGLFLHNVSKADIDQRAGRAGRTKAGEYYLCSDMEYAFREEYPVPEMQRSILDQVVLRLAAVDIDATKMEFFHQPSAESLNLACKTLINLGALKDGKITEIGRRMAKMPISAKYGRMIVEAEKYGVVEDVITITAILECGSLIDYRSGKGYINFSKETSSDLLAELDVWNKLMQMGYVDFKKEGINGKNFFRVKELRNKLTTVLSDIVVFGSSKDRESVKKSCVAGMVDNLYKSGWGCYIDANTADKQLDRKSVLRNCRPDLVVGVPLTIQSKNSYYKMHLICMATEVKEEWLYEIAPQMIVESDSEAYYSEEKGCYVYRTYTFNGVQLKTQVISVPDHPDALRLKEEYETRERDRNEWLSDMFWGSLYRNHTERQKEIVIEGKTFDVLYDWDSKPYITVNKEFLKTVSIKCAKLDDETVLTIRYHDTFSYKCLSANNFPALIEKAQKLELERAKDAVEHSLGNARSAKEDVVIPWFDKLGKVLIAKDWNGESIYGFVCLKLKDNMVSLELSDDEESAEASTEEAIRFLFGKAINTRYPQKKFEIKKYSKKAKQKSPEKELFDELVRDALKGLTVDNFSESLEMIDEFFKELVS